MADNKLDLILNIDMYQFIEKGARGRESYIAQRCSKANNNYMKSYDKDKPSKCIIYDDANNLYGWAMSKYFLVDGIKWWTQNEIDELDVSTVRKYNPKGCILEVDLEYPKELHHLLNYYPLTNEKIEIEEVLYQIIAQKLQISIMF